MLARFPVFSLSRPSEREVDLVDDLADLYADEAKGRQEYDRHQRKKQDPDFHTGSPLRTNVLLRKVSPTDSREIRDCYIIA